jgi:phosphatidylserine/phosphatidylglycerophosphate/cardiolipin synthase-like enzyme
MDAASGVEPATRGERKTRESMSKKKPERPPDRVISSVAERRPAILDVIRQASRQVTLSLFRCNDSEIIEELALATRRGVAVDILLTSRAKGDRKKLKKLGPALEATGASVHLYTDQVVKYHAKYLIADDGPALVASLNLTRKCLERTCDALVVTHDPAVVDGLRALMAADRERLPMPVTITDRLIIGPERARRQLTGLIERARSSIRLIDAKLSDPELVALLNARRDTGLTVEVFGSKRLGALRSHGKLMLIDDEIAVVGSLALSAMSLDFRREVAIVVDDPAAVADVRQLFRDLDAIPTQGRIGTGQSAGEALC